MPFGIPHQRHPEELEIALARIESAELVRRLDDPETAFLIKHALGQDTAYTSLLKQERKRLHLRIGVTLEQTLDAHADEFAAELARHFSEAGDAAKTFVYATSAGDTAHGDKRCCKSNQANVNTRALTLRPP